MKLARGVTKTDDKIHGGSGTLSSSLGIRCEMLSSLQSQSSARALLI